ncbi:alpha/beta-hydrolase [Rhizopogon salebrosus TDB-379]|nr:alpha/beta-hydrolase [Rhizopogon salebrosus TDB-379]
MLMRIDLLAQTLLQALLALGPSSSPLTPAHIVDLGYARYRGSVDTATNTTSFLGIRYAAPPVGKLRWAAPQHPQTTSGVQPATMQPNACYQAHIVEALTGPFESTSMSEPVKQSEDCLFLNVYTPGRKLVAAPSGGLPVVVWIHGGGYISGAANRFNGADLIMKSNHGVIVVSIQYRLGLFGFLAGEAVKEGGALNAGLLDQNYALQWLQAHIRRFGGDPTKVTIWGESAGAGSVLQHLVAHGGNTQPALFKAAMASSTFLPSQYNYNDRIPEMLYSEVVDGTNCRSKSDTLSCLRAADAKTLQTLNHNFNVSFNLHKPVGPVWFLPVVDGTFIVERPSVTISKGRLNCDLLLAVTNTHEGKTFVDQSMTLDIADYISTLFPNFGPAQAAGAAKIYQDLGNNVNQANLAVAESIFVCPTYLLLEALGEQAWKGEFALPPALHGSDMAYYFTSHGPAYKNPQFITSFSNSFMAMAMYGTPQHRYNSRDITPPWNPWSDGSAEMIFNKTSAGVPDVYTSQTDIHLLERCA